MGTYTRQGGIRAYYEVSEGHRLGWGWSGGRLYCRGGILAYYEVSEAQVKGVVVGARGGLGGGG